MLPTRFTILINFTTLIIFLSPKKAELGISLFLHTLLISPFFYVPSTEIFLLFLHIPPYHFKTRNSWPSIFICIFIWTDSFVLYDSNCHRFQAMTFVWLHIFLNNLLRKYMSFLFNISSLFFFFLGI